MSNLPAMHLFATEHNYNLRDVTITHHYSGFLNFILIYFELFHFNIWTQEKDEK